MKSKGTAVTLILEILPIIQQELLDTVDSVIGGHIVGNQQLVAPLSPGELLPQGNSYGVVDGNGANLAALALDRNFVPAECIFRNGRVDTEALMDAQAGVPGQVKGQNIIVAIFFQGGS